MGTNNGKATSIPRLRKIIVVQRILVIVQIVVMTVANQPFYFTK